MSEDARRLLRALVDLTMADRQTQDEEDVVGCSVSVSLPATEAAGIEGNSYYNERVAAALAQLVAVGALEYDLEATSQQSPILGSHDAYIIKRTGIVLLRETGV